MLEKIRKKLFSFIWTRRKDIEGIPVVKCTNLAKTKEPRGQGLKINYAFNQDLKEKYYGGFYFYKDCGIR